MEVINLVAICEATEMDLHALLEVERNAFGEEEGPVIVELVSNLLADPSAQPLLSLIALENEQVIGHILFTRAQVGSFEQVSSVILAPLAIAPDKQGRGIGGMLIKGGLAILAERGVSLVFVLGHPEYYPRHGFKAAGALGFEAPYPIPEEVAGAWMVQELGSGLIGSVRGKIRCARALDQPEYWRE